jgi:hypothetical protein
MSVPPCPPSSNAQEGVGDAEAERRTRGTPGEGALAEAARRTGMLEADVLYLALTRSAWKSMVAVRLGAGNAPAVIQDVTPGTREPRRVESRRRLRCCRPGAYLGSHHESAHATVATLAAAFDEHLAEVGPGAPQAFSAVITALRGKPVRDMGQDAGIGSRIADDGVEAADSEEHGALAARMEAHVSGCASLVPADSRGDTGVHGVRCPGNGAPTLA